MGLMSEARLVARPEAHLLHHDFLQQCIRYGNVVSSLDTHVDIHTRISQGMWCLYYEVG